MTNYFNNILIPVDFSINTDIAIAKALEINHGKPTSLYLHHTQQIRVKGVLRYMHYRLAGYPMRKVVDERKETEQKLLKLKRNIETNHPSVVVYTGIHFGRPVEESIANTARQLKPDLIIIGKHASHSIFPFLNTVVPTRIASATGIPVLATKPGSLNNHIKTIVMPVGNSFPARKLEMLEALRQNGVVSVRLVSFLKDEKTPFYSKQSLFKVFRSLKPQLAYPIECEVLEGNNKARALLEYCKRVEADVLIVHPVTETNAGGLINRQISDLLPSDSKTQVLTVQQS